MMRKRVRAGSAIFLALVLTFSIFVLPGVQAAGTIETDRTDCSVEFSVGSDYEDLETSDVTVKLYRVAAVDKSCTYTAEDDFAGLDVSSLDADDQSSAAKWSERAAQAAKIVSEKDLEPVKRVVTENGEVTATGLKTGLYLICPDVAVADNYTYTFAPSLVSLPNNYYYSSGNDEWVYSLTGTNKVTLKPEQHERYGDLVINKKLTGLNNTFGEKTTFVFRIAIEKLDGSKETKVESLTFDAVGSQSKTIKNLPAGAKVTVTEEYSGAIYKLTSANDQVTTILANDEYSKAGAASAEVSFENAPDDTWKGGYGVENHFEEKEDGLYYHVEQGSSILKTGGAD